MVIPFLDLESFPFSSKAQKLVRLKSDQGLILVWPFGDTNATVDDVVPALTSLHEHNRS
jgi:hypothetical protein